jgi:hypothetical protein
MYGQLVGQFSRYMGHVAKYVGGIMETPKMVEESGPVYEIVSEAKQKEAVEFLNKNLFTTPTWLINFDILNKISTQGSPFRDIPAENGGIKVYSIGTLQDNILNRLLGTRNLTKLVEAEASLGKQAYQITELLSDLKKGIFSEISARKPIDIYRRNLQKSYVNILDNIIEPASSGSGGAGISIIITSSATDKSDIKSVVRAHLTTLKSELSAAATAASDPMTKYHLADLVNRIDKTLNPK